MSSHFPALIIVVPLFSAFFIAAAGWFARKLCFPVALFGMAAALCSAIGIQAQVVASGPVVYHLGGWPPPWGIAYYIDWLNGIVLIAVAAVALINLFATRASVALEFSEKLGPFYSLYLLFVAGLLGIVVTGDAFNLYVLLEIAALTGYALIGMGEDRAPLAGLNYIFLGTIGASFYLLGIGYLYLVTGSLNMADIAVLLPPLYHSKVVLLAFIICLTGLFIKMALFPLHRWLPDAYSYGPSAAVSLIAPLTTKVMVYVMIRITLTVFTPKFAFANLKVSSSFVWLAAIAIIAASILALSQKSIRRMLAYVIIAEVGYMVGGLWLGNRDGITGAILHIINDAAMTLCVFLVVGNIMYKLQEDSFVRLQGLFRKMPFSMTALVIGALSIIGVPPTCGFFSKWYLLLGGIKAGCYGFVAALIFSSLVNVILFFRIFEIGFFEPAEENSAVGGKFADAPLEMLAPLLITAAILVILGFYTDNIVQTISQYVLSSGIT